MAVRVAPLGGVQLTDELMARVQGVAKTASKRFSNGARVHHEVHDGFSFTVRNGGDIHTVFIASVPNTSYKKDELLQRWYYTWLEPASTTHISYPAHGSFSSDAELLDSPYAYDANWTAVAGSLYVTALQNKFAEKYPPRPAQLFDVNGVPRTLRAAVALTNSYVAPYVMSLLGELDTFMSHGELLSRATHVHVFNSALSSLFGDFVPKLHDFVFYMEQACFGQVVNVLGTFGALGEWALEMMTGSSVANAIVELRVNAPRDGVYTLPQYVVDDGRFVYMDGMPISIHGVNYTNTTGLRGDADIPFDTMVDEGSSTQASNYTVSGSPSLAVVERRSVAEGKHKGEWLVVYGALLHYDSDYVRNPVDVGRVVLLIKVAPTLLELLLAPLYPVYRSYGVYVASFYLKDESMYNARTLHNTASYTSSFASVWAEFLMGLTLDGPVRPPVALAMLDGFSTDDSVPVPITPAALKAVWDVINATPRPTASTALGAAIRQVLHGSASVYIYELFIPINNTYHCVATLTGGGDEYRATMMGAEFMLPPSWKPDSLMRVPHPPTVQSAELTIRPTTPEDSGRSGPLTCDSVQKVTLRYPIRSNFTLSAERDLTMCTMVYEDRRGAVFNRSVAGDLQWSSGYLFEGYEQATIRVSRGYAPVYKDCFTEDAVTLDEFYLPPVDRALYPRHYLTPNTLRTVDVTSQSITNEVAYSMQHTYKLLTGFVPRLRDNTFTVDFTYDESASVDSTITDSSMNYITQLTYESTLYADFTAELEEGGHEVRDYTYEIAIEPKCLLSAPKAAVVTNAEFEVKAEYTSSVPSVQNPPVDAIDRLRLRYKYDGYATHTKEQKSKLSLVPRAPKDGWTIWHVTSYSPAAMQGPPQYSGRVGYEVDYRFSQSFSSRKNCIFAAPSGAVTLRLSNLQDSSIPSIVNMDPPPDYDGGLLFTEWLDTLPFEAVEKVYGIAIYLRPLQDGSCVDGFTDDISFYGRMPSFSVLYHADIDYVSFMLVGRYSAVGTYAVLFETSADFADFLKAYLPEDRQGDIEGLVSTFVSEGSLPYTQVSQTAVLWHNLLGVARSAVEYELYGRQNHIQVPSPAWRASDVITTTQEMVAALLGERPEEESPDTPTGPTQDNPPITAGAPFVISPTDRDYLSCSDATLYSDVSRPECITMWDSKLVTIKTSAGDFTFVFVPPAIKRDVLRADYLYIFDPYRRFS